MNIPFRSTHTADWLTYGSSTPMYQFFLVNSITELECEVYQSVSSKKDDHDGFRALLVSSRIGDHFGYPGKKMG